MACVVVGSQGRYRGEREVQRWDEVLFLTLEVCRDPRSLTDVAVCGVKHIPNRESWAADSRCTPRLMIPAPCVLGPEWSLYLLCD